MPGFKKFILIVLQILHFTSTQKQQQQPCINCYYGITRNNENEYLIIKNLFKTLFNYHLNITLDSINTLDKTSTTFLKTCDLNIDYVCIKQTISKDYRHPNHLFKNIKLNNITSKISSSSSSSSNNSSKSGSINSQKIKSEYEANWYLNYKSIDTNKHENSKYANFCNQIGLKLYCLLHDYINLNGKLNVCKMVSIHQDELLSSLFDYYMAQTFMKNCYGNLEMVSRGIYKLLKFDCQRAYTMKLTYYNSKYLNFIRTCDENTNLNDLIIHKLDTNTTHNSSNCTNIMHNFRNKRHCLWYEAICKHPVQCLKSLNWTDT